MLTNSTNSDGPSPSIDRSAEKGLSSSNPELSTESVVILSIICSLASVSGSIGNSLVILAVAKSESLRSIPDFIISSLACSDLTVCFIYLPLLIFQVTYGNNFFVNTAKRFFGHFSVIASITNMFVITIDRLLAVRFPLKYPIFVTEKVAFSSIAIVWLISLSFGAVYSQELNNPSHHAILTVYTTLLIFGTWAIYAFIFFAAKRQENKVVQPVNPATPPHISVLQQKATKTIFIVVGIYALCWLPSKLIHFFVNPAKNPILFKKSFFWIQAALACNSALNPYVYCIRSERYRKQFAKLLRIKPASDAQ